MSDRITPPARWHQMLEGRVGAEASMLLMQLPMLRMQTRTGTGPVMVLPGFMADDGSTWLLRRFLDALGYRVTGWGQGTNRGPMMSHLPALISTIEQWCAESGEQPSLVGWSRGGALAREIARDRPDLVRLVVTMGSPVRGGARATSIGRLVSAQTGMTPEQMMQVLRERQKRPIEIPIHAIYSKTDGVVAWQACVDDLNPDVTHYEVDSSHTGLGFNAAVYRIVGRVLAGSHNPAP